MSNCSLILAVFLAIFPCFILSCSQDDASKIDDTPSEAPLIREEPSEPNSNFSDAQEYFEKSVVPFFKTNCSSSGCHVNSIEVNLVKFPFDHDGSYLSQDLIAEFSGRTDEHIEQAFVIERLIDSMETAYMPPVFSDLPLASDEQIKILSDWLQMPYFNEKN